MKRKRTAQDDVGRGREREGPFGHFDLHGYPQLPESEPLPPESNPNTPSNRPSSEDTRVRRVPARYGPQQTFAHGGVPSPGPASERSFGIPILPLDETRMEHYGTVAAQQMQEQGIPNPYHTHNEEVTQRADEMMTYVRSDHPARARARARGDYDPVPVYGGERA